MSCAHRLTEQLGGRWHGTYGLAFCPAHENTRTPALSVRDRDDGGVWVNCFTGCNFRDVKSALRDRRLIDERPDRAGRDRSAATRRKAETESAEYIARAEWISERARELWDAGELIKGSPAALYLRERAITCALPPTLRYLPSCPHPSGTRHPAMIAKIDGATRFAVHRTYLAPDGIGKADAEPPKAMLGSPKGGAVRLAYNVRHSPGGALLVSEGIENGLSLLSGVLDEELPVWAALSTSGLRSLELPGEPGHLIIAGDADGAGRDAVARLTDCAQAEGWRVSHLTPPEGDWNDVLMGERGLA